MKNITIFVIDDDQANIQLMIDILEKSTYDCKIIRSTKITSAMEIAIEAKPSIIIADWEMPELIGMKLLKELKKNTVTKEIPVIITSAKLSSQNLKLALDSGAFDFIRKPIDEVELIARISSALRLVDYYNQKIEIQNREMQSKTMMLIKIIHAFDDYQEGLKTFYKDNCKASCKLPTFFQNSSNQIISTINIQIWEELELHYNQMNEPFYRNLLSQFPKLTKNELRLCAYLHLNLSTKDISKLTFQTTRSIEIARTRLRKKLGLKGSAEDLNSFLVRF
jgi:DNA-binding response OmpR family regulator